MGPGGGWNFRPVGGSYVYEQKGLSLEEVGHLLLTGSLGLVFRNPYLQIGTMFYHWIFHQEEPSSPGGGGPGLPPISTDPPPSIEETGGFIVDPPLVGASGTDEWFESHGYSRRGKRCPPGFHWSKRLRKCVKNTRFQSRYS